MKKQKSKLLDKTRQLLIKDERQDYIIAVDMGVSPVTIENIRKARVPSPGVVLIESLYEYLSNKKLKV